MLNQHPAYYYQSIIDHLNSLTGKFGWFSEHYGGKPNGGSSIHTDNKKKMWQLHNTMKLDAIREEIEKVVTDPIEKSVLLTSLIYAMDKVDSSVGHHVSYLKEWAPRAYNKMKMSVPNLIIDDKPHRVLNSEVFKILDDIEVDLAYFDPPYGSANELMPPSRVRYASYYHLWKSICLNDKPKVSGAANRREDVSDVIAGSVFEEFRKNESGRYLVIDALKNLIDNTKAKYIVLSYNNNGRATFDSIIEILEELNLECSIIEMDYKKNVMATMAWTNEWINDPDVVEIKNKEFLFLIRKDPTAESIGSLKMKNVNLSETNIFNQQNLF
ncbi:MAG: DNA adenine methylase [Pyrinomonadaceae bacterium]